MKRFLPAVLLFLFVTQAYSLKLGLEFTAAESQSLAANLRFSDEFELKPRIGFVIGDASMFSLGLDANIYLARLGELEQYVGPGVSIVMYEGANDAGSYNSFSLNGQYGLRYTVNDYISIFGEVGIGMLLDPFVMSTFRPGLGCTIYLPAFD